MPTYHLLSSPARISLLMGTLDRILGEVAVQVIWACTIALAHNCTGNPKFVRMRIAIITIIKIFSISLYIQLK